MVLIWFLCRTVIFLGLCLDIPGNRNGPRIGFTATERADKLPQGRVSLVSMNNSLNEILEEEKSFQHQGLRIGRMRCTTTLPSEETEEVLDGEIP